MKVYVKTPPKLSQAMYRVANALERFSPFEVVQTEDEADLLVLHVIGLEAVNYRTDKPCAVIQYCTGGGELEPWYSLWRRAKLVWSYYDLQKEFLFDPQLVGKFYHAPLGIDPAFRSPFANVERDYLVMTSGYVNGMPQEAIEEPTLAAYRLSGKPIHLGKIPVGLTRPLDMNLLHSPGDTELANHYRRCKWIAGLRYVEGFELGVIEGLACGARPIVFDRPDNRRWFGGHAVYVPECTGDRLTDWLAVIMSQEPQPVTLQERMEVLTQFNWKSLVTGFWNLVKERT